MQSFHLNTKENTFFSVAHRTFDKIDYTVRHKENLNKYKKIKIAPSFQVDYHKLKLSISNGRNKRKFTNSEKLHNSLLNEKWFKTKSDIE